MLGNTEGSGALLILWTAAGLCLFSFVNASGLASAKKHEFSHGQKPLPLLWADAKLEGLDSGVQLAAAKRTLSVLRGENPSALPADGAVGRLFWSLLCVKCWGISWKAGERCWCSWRF